eukprot:TRINITY_DN3573_c3_g1_i1.p1 TRINITY_DN3573_c3_g1~~TRINITY_DN3573_c3_g1_i1.p1  ORF type:complete len:1288 (+),score=504.95 TRINITY_DN3573_c3_g1_i1:352-3864(+)
MVKTDGGVGWISIRDLLYYSKQNEALWAKLQTIGVNNMSEKKLFPHEADLLEAFELSKDWCYVKPKPEAAVRSSRGGGGDEEQFHEEPFEDVVVKPVPYADCAMLRRLEADVAAAVRATAHLSKRAHTNGVSNLFEAGSFAARRGAAGSGAGDEGLDLDSLGKHHEVLLRSGAKQQAQLYRDRLALRRNLPAFQEGRAVVDALARHDVVVLCGATGCGKTTQLPQLLLEATRHLGSRILCTQPRRISATSVAERVAYERGEAVGGEVGYQIRFDYTGDPAKTRLLYCTVGILLRFLTTNPMLEGTDYVVVDEVHERGIHTDFVLLILRDVVQQRRAHATLPPLKLLLMSATIDASGFLRYFDAAAALPDSPSHGAGTPDPQAADLAAALGTTRATARALLTQHGGDADRAAEAFLADGAPQTPSPHDGTGAHHNFKFDEAHGYGFDVAYFSIPGSTNYPIEEIYAEDILRDAPAHVTILGGTQRDKKGRNEWAHDEGALWAALQVAREAAGLPPPGKVSAKALSNLQTLVTKPLKVDVELIKGVMEMIEAREEGSRSRDAEERKGSVLIFVPGWQDITDVINALEKMQRAEGFAWRLLPLHSMIPPKDQKRIFEAPRDGERKVIVSTNLAETSITVEDVVYVVDSGLMKGTLYTPDTNIASLENMRSPRSSAQQRRGRAGRCQPGVVYKLYSSIEWHQEMADHDVPEMLRTPVEELCLQVKALGLPGTVRAVLKKAIAPPSTRAVDNAVTLLLSLGAFDAGGGEEVLTSLGWKLSLLPIHPCLGKMLLLGSLFSSALAEDEEAAGVVHTGRGRGKGAGRGQGRGRGGAASAAAPGIGAELIQSLLSVSSVLSFKSPFVLPFGKEREADAARKRYGEGLQSDHFLFADVASDFEEMSRGGRGGLRRWIDDSFLSETTLEMCRKTQKDLRSHLTDLGIPPPPRGTPNANKGAKESDMGEATLMAVIAASLNLSFLPPGARTLGDIAGTGGPMSQCHPSSLLADLGAPVARKGRGAPVASTPQLFVVGWFERLKTSKVFLRDCSLVRDALPLLLLLPHCAKATGEWAHKKNSNKEATPPTVFEVTPATDAAAKEEPLRFHVHCPDAAALLWELRRDLAVLIDRVVGLPQGELAAEVRRAFATFADVLAASWACVRQHGGGGASATLRARNYYR